MSWYIRLVTRWPWLVIGFDLLLVFIMGPIAIWYAGVPDFSDPNKGFEPRGTLIQGWNEAAVRLSSELINNGSLSYFPNEFHSPEVPRPYDINIRRKRDSHDTYFQSGNAQECLNERLEGVAQRIVPAVQQSRMKQVPTAIPRMVMETNDQTSLWTANHMRSICSIEKQYVTKRWGANVCPAFSLPYYIGILRNKTCSNIQEDDMEAVLGLLRYCSPYYIQGILTDSCGDISDNQNNTICSTVPEQCTTHNAPFYILHFLTDNNFLKNNFTYLEYSMLIYRKSWGYDKDSMFEHYKQDIEQWSFNIKHGGVTVQAMDYYMIFREVTQLYILSDIIFYAFALTLVVVVLLMYLRSFSLMIAVILTMELSLFTAYFMYSVAFQFKYFSFMNMLAGLLLIAVGADDVFILHDIWHGFKMAATGDITIETLTKHTLRHGLISILVTSMTTAAALFANGISDVTALKCFGVFGGICILVNFFYMITLVPAILVLGERYERRNPDRCKANCCTQVIDKITSFGRFLWGRAMPFVVLKPFILWIIIFSIVGIGAFVAVFYYPQLQLIKTERIKVFYAKHPFEVYRDKMMTRFNFEIANIIRTQVNLQLLFLFGVKGEDNGNVLDPDDRGTLEFDNTFEIYSEESQLWLDQFCQSLSMDEYTVSHDKHMCIFNAVREISRSRQCRESNRNSNNTPIECCSRDFPMKSSNAAQCFQNQNYIKAIYRIAADNNKSLLGTPVFKYGTGDLVAITFQIESDFVWTPKQSEMDKYYKRYTRFMKNMLQNAPTGLRDGWFSGANGEEFFFYDLLTAVLEGTISGIALSMGVAFFVMMVTSGNIIITIYSMVTIAFVIACTVASLVLMGWEFAILESLVITLAVGLSIDFTIHFAVAYKVSHYSKRAEKAESAIKVVGSAVTMAGLTTFLAGAAICVGRVISYFRFGVFLMLDMTISWAFSMFFFIPLCRLIGPEGSAGDLKALGIWIWRRCCCCWSRSRTRSSQSRESKPGSHLSQPLTATVQNGKIMLNPYRKTSL